jgi:murein DD-endopeptidase MepM/ murein hydrolase activator NlpD
VQVLTNLPRVVSGHFLVPIAGAVLTQGFGPTDLWFEPPLGKFAHFHTGLDLAASEGTPVVAAADGVVTAVGSTRGGYGNFVVIAHGGDLMTLYGHLQTSIVTAGQAVKAGQVIGAEGSTGFSTGPHLHFEVRVKNNVVDPTLYLATLSATQAPAPAATANSAPPGPVTIPIDPGPLG